MIVTASKIPVPDPMAPMKSARTERAPMQSPPNAAAVGMYLLSSWIMDVSRCPLITICCSLSCLATSLAELPDTSIQVFEKKAQLPSMKVRGNSRDPNRVGTAAASITPHTEKVHEEVTSELDTEHLGDHVEIGHESRLENDGDVGGVEQLDGVAAVLSSVPGALDG